ncbi:MAG: hypothetical protein KC621_17870 [Myxococcales bacterium]|nr:hypothetical protein [Myxococcales bacterium]
MGLPAPHETTDARVCAHLTELPDRRWWLDEVRLKDFPRIRRLTETPDRLRVAVDDAYFTPEAARVRERIVEVHGDTEAVRLNLLMVSAFLFHRKSVAVLDVAAEHLSPDEVTLNTGLAGSQNRLALAALLYWKDRDLLVALDLWDRWHSRRRCVLGLEGHRRSPLPLPSIPWADLASQALADLEDGDPLQLRAVVRRRGGREVMVAFRQVGEWSNVRSESGEVLPGREDDWTLLLFHDGGNSVDVTASALDRANVLADAIGGRAWSSAVRYEPIRRPLREKDLRRLLDRLTDPDDDTFRLLELVGVVPQLPERPVMVVGNAGQTRVERALREIRRSVPLGYDWRNVHSVKVGFLDQYRITLHFPAKGEELLLTYSDVDRNKDASRAFEALVADELGVVIKPKVAAAPVRGSDRSRRPRRVTAEHYRAMLEPVLDDPPDWVVDELGVLARDGLVLPTRHAVLRCGDAWTGASGGGDTLDCPGEIEMPWAPVDAATPFAQDEGAEHACGHCGRVWRPGRTALPLFLRVRVAIDHDRVWSWLLERVRSRAWVESHEPGVASGRYQDKTSVLVYLPLAVDPAARSIAHAATFPTCWVGQPTPRAYHERGVDLADVLADDVTPVMRAWRLGRDRALVGRAEPEEPMLAAEPAGPYVVRLPRRPKVRTFTVDDAGVWLDGQLITDGRASGSRMLLALLWEAAKADDASKEKKRLLRTLNKLGGRGDLKFQDKAVYQWICRLRERVEQVFPDEAHEVIVSQRGSGYRLGDGVVCLGLDLSAEIARFRAGLLANGR